MDAKTKKLLKRVCKEMQTHRFDQTETNADCRGILDRYTVDGIIGIVVSGMDCDCSQYYREYTRPSWSSVIAFKRWFDKHQEGLDGPETMTFRKPDRIVPQYQSRDLALEAFEDGHPHVVYT